MKDQSNPLRVPPFIFSCCCYSLALVLGTLNWNDSGRVQVFLPVLDRLPFPVLALQRAAEHILRQALDVLMLLLAAMAAHRSLHVELLRALAVRGRASVAPDLFALCRRRGTVPLKAVACVHGEPYCLIITAHQFCLVPNRTCGFVSGVVVTTRTAVLHIDIRWTQTTLARTELGQIALVWWVPA